MTRRSRNLVAVGLAVCGFLVAATYKPFGGSEGPAVVQIPDPMQSGYETGIHAAGLAPDEVARFKTDEHLARYIAVREGVPKEMRDVWCKAFVHGLAQGRRIKVVRDEVPER